MKRLRIALGLAFMAAALSACETSRFSNPLGSSARVSSAPAARAPVNPNGVRTLEPLAAEPTAPISAEPLAPIAGAPLPPIGTPTTPEAALPIGQQAGLPADATLPPVEKPKRQPTPESIAAAQPTKAPTRVGLIGTWAVQDTASGGKCRVQLSSSNTLDLYRASSSNCANKDIERVSAWDYRDGEVYLYQSGGAVVARLRPSGSAMSGALTKSGAPIGLSR
jgi:Protease inhibitor Inh